MSQDSEHPQPVSVAVLTIDRLRSSMLGPYGNTSVDTPEFDRLASRSILFDQAIAGQADLISAMDDFWGTRQAGDSDATTLTDRVAAAGMQSLLITDDVLIAASPAADTFDEVVQLQAPETQQAAATVADTSLAFFFAQALKVLGDLQPGTFVWLHCRGMSGPWDAPTEYRELMAGPDDPDPPGFVQPPASFGNLDQADPDVLLGLEQAYAAQVVLLDQFLGVWQDQFESVAALRSTWFCLAAPRGCALGEHGLVGDGDSAATANELQQAAKLNFENVHVPLMICPPTDSDFDAIRGSRCGQLIQASWLRTLLAGIIRGGPQAAEVLIDILVQIPGDGPGLALSQAGQAVALQTRHWKLIRSATERLLYAKPDDRWEVNDVASRCPQVVWAMEEAVATLLESGMSPGVVDQLNLPSKIS